MEIQLRSIPHAIVERDMGHCLHWPTIDVDAVSCTYNPVGFSPMLAVIRDLERDRDRFTHPALSAHHLGRFSVVSHEFEDRPLIITSSKTAAWDSEPHVAAEVIRVADAENSRSLCMTHFSFVLGRFPTRAFELCVRAAMLARYSTRIEWITIDVDDRYRSQGKQVLQGAIRSWDPGAGSDPRGLGSWR